VHPGRHKHCLLGVVGVEVLWVCDGDEVQPPLLLQTDIRDE